MEIDCFVVGNCEQPTPQVGGLRHFRVGAQGGHEGLLKAVFGVVATDRGNQKPIHIFAMGIKQFLERRQLHITYNADERQNVRSRVGGFEFESRSRQSFRGNRRRLRKTPHVVRVVDDDLDQGKIAQDETGSRLGKSVDM